MESDVTEIINRFLNRWTLKDVRSMTLEDYIDFNVGINNTSHFGSINTFCYWVEYSFWAARTNRSEAPNHRVFRFNNFFCNRYGIASPSNQNSATNHKEFPDYAAKFSPKNYNAEVNKPKKFPYSDLVDKEGIYYDEYSSEEEINKEGFYVSDEYNWKEELNHISAYGYSVYSLRKSESNYVDWSTECDFLNGKIYRRNKKYRWIGSFGENLKEAFQNIKVEILNIIEFSQNNDFDKIEESKLSDIFTWKIAYLYSSEYIIPIFRQETLEKCAENFGFQVKLKTNLSEIQKFLIERKPTHFKNNFDYARYLLWSVSKKKLESGINAKAKNTRKSVEIKSVEQQTRKAIDSYTVEQRHNLLQNKFSEKLVAKFGKSVVKMEENYVDVKLYTPDTIIFYEVKSDASASVCIKNALGQILWYAFADSDERKKKIVVVGQFPPTNQEILFIDFLKQSLQIEFDYEYIDVSDENEFISSHL